MLQHKSLKRQIEIEGYYIHDANPKVSYHTPVKSQDGNMVISRSNELKGEI
jgi:hypothetical protein